MDEAREKLPHPEDGEVTQQGRSRIPQCQAPSRSTQLVLGQSAQEVADSLDNRAQAGEDGTEHVGDCIDEINDDRRHDGYLSVWMAGP